MLRGNGPLGISELVRRTGLSRPTVELALRGLQDGGMVVAAGIMPQERAGRPSRRFCFRPEAGLAMGLDWGPHNLRAAVADLGGRVLCLAERPGSEEDFAAADPSALAALAADALGHARRQLARSGQCAPRLMASVLAIPVGVDTGGQVTSASLAPSWVGRSPGTALAARLGAPVAVLNDATAATLGELSLGPGPATRDVVHVQLGRRMAVGLVLGGSVHQGADHLAGCVAHLFGRNIDDLGQLKDPDGGEPSREVVLDALVRGVTSLVLALNPHEVVLSGAGAQPLRECLEDLAREVRSRLSVPSRVDLRVSRLTSQATVVGALACAEGLAAQRCLGAAAGPPRWKQDSLWEAVAQPITGLGA